MRPVILVVEGNDNVRDAVCRWVTCMFPEGKLLAARSGREAIRRAELSRPTIALLDVELDDMPAGVTKQFIEAMSPTTEVVLFAPEKAAEPAGASQSRPAVAPSDPVPYYPSIEGVFLN